MAAELVEFGLRQARESVLESWYVEVVKALLDRWSSPRICPVALISSTAEMTGDRWVLGGLEDERVEGVAYG